MFFSGLIILANQITDVGHNKSLGKFANIMQSETIANLFLIK